MAKIDQFIVPGDLDLDRVTLTIVPGSHFFLGAYTYQVSSRWENGKGVKITEHTDVYTYVRRTPAWSIYISASPQIKIIQIISTFF